MAETYCGKQCTDCEYRQRTSCPGCRVGPGRSLGGECDIARCCREKSHESCDTCIDRGKCGKYFQRDTMAEYRNKKLEREQQAQEIRRRKAAFLGEWTQRLFWLIIFANIAALLSIEQLVAVFPALRVPGQLLNVAVSVGYGWILLKMVPEEPRFQTAGWCVLGLSAVNFLFLVIFGMKELPVLIAIPVIAVGLLGDYNEFIGFADALESMDTALSEKWRKLWKWSIGCYGAMLGSILLVLILPLLGVLVVLAASIALLVIGIIQMIYIYRTFKAFQSFCR